MKFGVWFWAVVLVGIAAVIVTFAAFLPPPAPVRSPGPATTGEQAQVSTAPDLPAEVDPWETPGSTRLTRQEPAPSAATGQWEEHLDSLLSSDQADDASIARQLFAALPPLPPEGQDEYLAHALNLCADEQFAIVERIYLDPGMRKEVVEAIFDDALNRPDELKLPLLAKSLAKPGHPMHEEAREILEMYLDLEPGQIPHEGWEAAVQKFLREEATGE